MVGGFYLALLCKDVKKYSPWNSLIPDCSSKWLAVILVKFVLRLKQWLMACLKEGKYLWTVPVSSEFLTFQQEKYWFFSHFPTPFQLYLCSVDTQEAVWSHFRVSCKRRCTRTVILWQVHFNSSVAINSVFSFTKLSNSSRRDYWIQVWDLSIGTYLLQHRAQRWKVICSTEVATQILIFCHLVSSSCPMLLKTQDGKPSLTVFSELKMQFQGIAEDAISRHFCTGKQFSTDKC